MAHTVLIVDDVPFVRKTLRNTLANAGFQIVAEAASGKEAVDLFVRHSPDIVTMDVVMPSMSGIEAIRQMIKINKDARIVVVSAMSQENLIMEAIHVGARDYVLKPFSSREIVGTLQRVIAGDEKTNEKTAASPKAEVKSS